MMNMYFEDLAAAAGIGDVEERFSEATQAIAALRFHEGLRRRWENARAEASVREATAVALLEGLRTSVDDVRTLSMTPPGERRIDQEILMGIWRAQWNITESMPPLNTRAPHSHSKAKPLPALLAGLHRNVSAGWEQGKTNGTIAVPTNPSQVNLVSQTVAHAQRSAIPTLAAAADLWARFRCHDIFTPGSFAVGAALTRWLLVHRGTEPTGVAVISAWHAQNPELSGQALSVWKEAQRTEQSRQERIDRLGEWLHCFATGIVEGARIGQDIALHIQAGRLSPTATDA